MNWYVKAEIEFLIACLVGTVFLVMLVVADLWVFLVLCAGFLGICFVNWMEDIS